MRSMRMLSSQSLKRERVQERNEGVGKGEQLHTGRACNSFVPDWCRDGAPVGHRLVVGLV